MMKEIGGYIELDQYHLPMLHEKAIALNCGRNCLAYLILTKKIEKLVIPYFLCDSVKKLCEREHVKVRYYHIDQSFMPENVEIQEDEWLYIVNYYGQYTCEQICSLKKQYDRIIVDNAQAYFCDPIENIDTLYTCRKFFGVADGAFLYTDKTLETELEIDESFERMHFILGRFERTASEFYGEYASNNHMFANEPVKQMSRLTKNLLHAVDYDHIKSQRTANFECYAERLCNINSLELHTAEGAFAYPLLIEDGARVRKKLQAMKLYIPTLWPNVAAETPKDSLEYHYSNDILPLPCDQRYGEDEIDYIVSQIKNMIDGGDIRE